MKQSKKIKQNCTGTGNFDIYFCVIFVRYCQGLISERETTGYYALSSLNFEIFQFWDLVQQLVRQPVYNVFFVLDV